MRVLLDECVPVQVARALADHEVRTTVGEGWRSVGNGELLRRAEGAGFAVFVIADKNLRYQQNLSGRRIAIVELWTNHRPTLDVAAGRIRAAVERAALGDYIVVAPE